MKKTVRGPLGAGTAEEAYKKSMAAAGKWDWDSAIAAFSEVIRLNPQWANGYEKRGFCYNRKGEFDKAIADYTEAIRLDPKFASAYCSRGEPTVARAIRQGNRRLHRGHSPQSEVRLGVLQPRRYAYKRKGDHDKAIADYTEAIRLLLRLTPPGFGFGYAVVWFYHNRGVAYKKKPRI